jgi:hypothetical protein
MDSENRARIQAEAMLVDAVAEFKKSCLRYHEQWDTPLDKVDDLLEHIFSDPLLVSFFCIAFSLYNREDRLLVEMEMNRGLLDADYSKFTDKMQDLGRQYWPYAQTFKRRAHAVWLTVRKILAGDTRSYAEVLEESFPQQHTVTDDSSTRAYWIRRQEPLLPDAVDRIITYQIEGGQDKHVVETHYFGIGPESKTTWQNVQHELARDLFSEDWKVFPDRSQTEYLWHYHSKQLRHDILWPQLEALCEQIPGVPLAWGPKFINLISKEITYVRNTLKESVEWQEIPDAISSPSHYPTKYWLFVEHPSPLKNRVSYHFLGAINKLDQCCSVEAIPAWIKTVLKNAVSKWLTREKSEPDLKTLSAEFEFQATGTLLPTIEMPDLEELFPDRIRRYVAENIHRKSKEIAAKIGLSDSRVRQIRKEVTRICDDHCEKIAHLGVYIPGPVDEIRRIAKLIYRKPEGQHPDSCPGGRVSGREKRRAELIVKHPALHEKIKKS